MELGFKELMKLKANDWQSKPFDQNGFAKERNSKVGI